MAVDRQHPCRNRTQAFAERPCIATRRTVKVEQHALAVKRTGRHSQLRFERWGALGSRRQARESRCCRKGSIAAQHHTGRNLAGGGFDNHAFRSQTQAFKA